MIFVTVAKTVPQISHFTWDPYFTEQWFCTLRAWQNKILANSMGHLNAVMHKHQLSFLAQSVKCSCFVFPVSGINSPASLYGTHISCLSWQVSDNFQFQNQSYYNDGRNVMWERKIRSCVVMQQTGQQTLLGSLYRLTGKTFIPCVCWVWWWNLALL